VGQAAIQGALLAGASEIIAVDPVPLKREVALTMGPTDVIDPTSVPVRDAVSELTRGMGVDYAFEATGSTVVARESLALLRRGGALVIVGCHVSMLNWCCQRMHCSPQESESLHRSTATRRCGGISNAYLISPKPVASISRVWSRAVAI
jgi:threonine dehydrogenase-like Zn-dependent dehydrogenase